MAVMQLKKVISQNPKMVKAYQLLALLYIKYGEWDKAGRLLKKAAQIDNTNTTTLRYLSAVQQERGKRYRQILTRMLILKKSSTL